MFILSFGVIPSPCVRAPPPVPVSSPSKMLCARKCKFPILALLMFPCPLFLAPPQTERAEQMARVLPQCLPCVYGEESGRGSAHSEQAALTPTTGCFLQAAPLLQNRASASRSSRQCASIQPHLVCTSTAAGRGEVAFSRRFSGSGTAT